MPSLSVREQVKKSGKAQTCSVCQNPFADAQSIVGLIHYDFSNQTLNKQYFCQTCWPVDDNSRERESGVVIWHRVYNREKKDEKRKISGEELYRHFKDMYQEEGTSQQRSVFLYLMALLLLRKKKLVLRESKKDDQGVMRWYLADVKAPGDLFWVDEPLFLDRSALEQSLSSLEEMCFSQ